jgi:hypothetical protein
MSLQPIVNGLVLIFWGGLLAFTISVQDVEAPKSRLIIPGLYFWIFTPFTMVYNVWLGTTFLLLASGLIMKWSLTKASF